MFTIILNIISNISIWPIDVNLTDTAILSLSWPEINDNKEVIRHSAELQNWNITTGCSKASYLWHLFFGGGLIPLQRMQSAYSKPHQQSGENKFVEVIRISTVFRLSSYSFYLFPNNSLFWILMNFWYVYLSKSKNTMYSFFHLEF